MISNAFGNQSIEHRYKFWIIWDHKRERSKLELLKEVLMTGHKWNFYTENLPYFLGLYWPPQTDREQYSLKVARNLCWQQVSKSALNTAVLFISFTAHLLCSTHLQTHQGSPLPLCHRL